MKINVAGILCLGAVLCSCTTTYSQNAPVAQKPFVAAPIQAYTLAAGPTGRYLIFTAEYDSLSPIPLSNGGTQGQRMVIRIDTQTGQTWELGNLMDERGNLTVAWLPIAESHPKGN